MTCVITFLVASAATAAVTMPADPDDRPRRAAASPAAAGADRAIAGDTRQPAGLARPGAPGLAAADPAATPGPIPAGAAPLPVDRLQAALDAYLASRPGLGPVAVGVTVAAPGGMSWLGGTHPRPAEHYGVLSITKTFTEALVLREAARGRIDLDAAMPQLPGVVSTPAGVVITPRMLLQHTSGVVNYMSAAGYDRSAMVTPAQLVSLSLKSPLLAPPGEKAAYSNTNFHWLGLLLEHVTGRVYGDLVRDLAAEVGLAQTALDPTGRPGWIGYASGGIRSTVPDLLVWASALFTPGRVLQAPELADLITLGPKGVSHGLWPIAGGVGQVVAHGGIVYFPQERLAVVVRIDPATPDAGAHTAELASTLRAAAAGEGLAASGEG